MNFDFNVQCPNRGPALTHMRDVRKRADGGCLFCGFGGRVNVCKGFACIANTLGDYCQNCVALRAQHALSHKLEGHTYPILMCPPCEGE